MKLQQFKYKLTEDRIAQEPTPFRDDCRLMVIHAKRGIIEHHDSFRDVLNYFDEEDLMPTNSCSRLSPNAEEPSSATGNEPRPGKLTTIRYPTSKIPWQDMKTKSASRRTRLFR